MTRLTLVPTPIGNLKDITLRALDVLERADVVAAEDTRRTRTLLAHYGIRTPLVRLDAHTVATRAAGILERNGSVAFVTDSGTPGISDPGADLVRLALHHDVEIEVLPGATAFVPALVLSGLPVARFHFEGFLPRKGGARRRRLERIASSEVSVALYEAAPRVEITLQDLIEYCGPERAGSLSRELSKRFEATLRGSLSELHSAIRSHPLKGELVLVVGPGRGGALPVDLAELVRQLAAEGLAGRELREALEARGVPRNEAYELALGTEV